MHTKSPDFENFTPIDFNDYSQAYLEDRLNLYVNYILDDESGVYHYDQASGKGIGQTNTNSPGNYSRVVFVNDNYVYAPVYGKSYGKLTFYGNEKDNKITAKSRADNYVEGGLGSDTITTGMGDDTIYTNAKINSNDDNEDENTTNTVYAGEGADTVYGSKGTDIIYGDFATEDEYSILGYFKNKDDFIQGAGGADTLIGGKGDDILIGGFATSRDDNASDTLEGGSGFDTYRVNTKI